MIKGTKTVILILTAFLAFQDLHAQTPAGMKDYLVQKFKAYCTNVPREEIFLQTDRDEYIAGEEMWLNIYLIDRQSFTPSVSSSITYVELLSSENRPVMQRRVLIHNGSGPGMIEIPDTLSSGTYTLRAYTGWMKNFLPLNCFSKEITVYNTLGDKASVDKITKITSPGNQASVKSPNRLTNNNLSIKIDNSAPDAINILVTADDFYLSLSGDMIYLFIQTHGNINYVGSEKISSGTTRIPIPKSMLSEGINQVTIFSSRGIPVAEGYSCTLSGKKARAGIKTSESYGLRSEVTLEIETDPEILSNLKSGNLSISVAPETGKVSGPDLPDYIFFGSEYGSLPWDILRGRNINDIKGNELDSLLEGISSYWIKWPEILSSKVPELRYPHEKESQTLTGRLLSSDQQPAGKGELLFMCIPGKQPGFQYARTDYRGSFSFNVHTDEEMKDLVFLPDDIGRNHKMIIEHGFSDIYTKPVPLAKPLTGQVPAYVQKWSINYQVGKIYRSSQAGKSLAPFYPALKQVRFYGKPDLELKMADYIKLPVMEEVIFELLPQVSLKKRDGKYEIVMHDRIDDILYLTVPVLMIDGVIVKDAALIVNLDPEAVERIDVVNSKYLVGKYLFPSILNIVTKSGDFTSVNLPDYMIRIPYRVADPVPSFVSPDYSSAEMKNKRLPDYRNTLYWNPAVSQGNDGKIRISFWSSDNAADYNVSLNGLTSDGKAISARKVIHVK